MTNNILRYLRCTMWRFDICIYCELSPFSKTAHFQMVEISNLRTSLERNFSTSHTPPSSSIILSSPWSRHSTEITLNKFTMSLNPLTTQMFLVLISFLVSESVDNSLWKEEFSSWNTFSLASLTLDSYDSLVPLSLDLFFLLTHI